MRRLCCFIVLLIVCLVNSHPMISGGLGQLENTDRFDRNQLQSLENQQPLEYRSLENEETDSLQDACSPILLLDDLNSVNVADFEQQNDRSDPLNIETPALDELDDRGKRSNSDDLLLDSDIQRYEAILAETGKALERSALTEDELQSQNIDSSNREKRSASSNLLEDEAADDESEDNSNANEEGDDSEGSNAEVTFAEEEESNASSDDSAVPEETEVSDMVESEDDSDAEESEDNDSEDGTSEDEASEDGTSKDQTLEELTSEDEASESDDANVDAAEDQAEEDDAVVNDAAEDDVEDNEDDLEEENVKTVNKNDADLEDLLTEVKSLNDYIEGLDAQTDELSQLRDELSSVLESEFIPKDSSRTRRQAVKRVGRENTVDYLKSLPQYRDVPREVLQNIVQSLPQSNAEVKQPDVVEEAHEPQPSARQAVRVPKADMPTMAPPQAPTAPCFSGSSSKEPQTKEEKELDKVIDMRKAEEAIVAKEQDDVIRAEHLAHTMQEDLHDVMREIGTLKREINAERKDAEKISVETKEAQKDLEMHDEKKYNARRKVDELYMRLTELESDTCDNRSKRKTLERFLDTEHYVLARRRRMLKEKQKYHHAKARAVGNVALPSNVRQSGGVQPTHKADELGQVVMSQVPAPESPAVARQAKTCEQAPASDVDTKKDQEYNNILEQIIIEEAQVKVEDVQVARAEEEAVALHKRLSSVLSKLAALSIEMKNLQTQAQVSGKRAKEAQAELAYHDQIVFTARKKVNAARNLESDLQRAIADQRMNNKGQCTSTLPP